ncbi:MAG: SBBP repeat-containing protein, partial [Terriglobales bacterium]
MKAALLAVIVLAAAGVMLHFGASVHAAKGRAGAPPAKPVAHSLSLPMFFEPNQGQTAPQVKFMARGAGYGLFLTADEAVLKLQQSVPAPRTATPVPSPKPASVIRMKLEGANESARVAGVSPLPGKSNYFIGNDRSKWRQNIPQFARVQYQAVYPGVDLVYYGNQGQLEYDFRVAPGSDPNQIALSFAGADVHVDSENSGDLVLSTANGDVRFHAPHIYQPGTAEKTVVGSFRQLADNKIGFAIGDYDHSRELVIDPVLSYSTYLGGGGESLVKIAVDNASNIYVAGSTTSADFPLSGSSPPYIPPLQTGLGGSGAQNLFISKINPTPQAGFPELVFSTYLGGSGTDSLAGIAVDSADNIYVAGSTTSSNFPTTTTGYQQAPQTGSHGFVTAIAFNGQNNTYGLTYSTYLAGNLVDTITGLAIDNSCNPTCNAYVTGVTTSSNPETQLNPFPASPEGFQTTSNSPGNAQFFATKIATNGVGYTSIAYSTYFGGGNFGTTDIAVGGGIAVDPSANQVNMYFTGTTNQLGVSGAGGTLPFPLFNAQQSCLNEAGQTNCNSQTPTTTTDAFAAKINPNVGGSIPVYSTYLGGSSNDNGNAIAVDTSGNTYVVGSTSSSDWIGVGGGFQTVYNGLNGATNAFIAKIGPSTGTQYPIIYFTYLGGAGPDLANDIKVDSVQAAHVVGTTSSPYTNPFPTTLSALQPCLGEPGAPAPCTGDPYTDSDAFVALISTTMAGTLSQGTAPPGDYSTYLGGALTDQGTGIALDTYNLAYVAGVTQSTNFPVTTTAYQGTLVGSQNAFVTKIGASSTLQLTYPSSSP